MAKKKIINVPFESLIMDKDFNARQEYREIDELKSSIMASGLLQPFGVTPKTNKDNEEPRYYIVYGFRRYLSICKIREELGPDAWATVDVVLNEGTLEELRDRNFKENMDRDDLKPYEIADHIKKMVNSGIEQRDIAKRLGRPQSWVSYHYKAASKLNTNAWNAFKEGDLTLEQALHIADIPEDDQTEVVEQVLGAETRSEARQVAKKASKEKGERRSYVNKGRPTAKNIAQYVSDASFEATSDVNTAEQCMFHKGVAAGLRVALGDLEFDVLTPKGDYADCDFHAKGRKENTETKKEPKATTRRKNGAKAKASGKKTKKSQPEKAATATT
jgi:ParB/RepB/Spo0J family partition protein